MAEKGARSATMEWKQTSYARGVPALADDRDGLTPTEWLGSYTRIDGPKVRLVSVATMREPRFGEPHDIRLYLDAQGRRYAHLEDVETFVDQRVTLGAVPADRILSVEDLFTVVDVDALIVLVQRMLQTAPRKSQQRRWQNTRALVDELPAVLAKVIPPRAE